MGELSAALQQLNHFKEMGKALGLAPSEDVASKIRTLETQMLADRTAHERQMLQATQSHNDMLVKLQMDTLRTELAELRSARSAEIVSRTTPEAPEVRGPQFEEVDGFRIPKLPDGELDYSVDKILKLNAGKALEQIIALASLWKDNKDNERKAMMAQLEAAEKARQQQQQQPLPALQVAQPAYQSPVVVEEPAEPEHVEPEPIPSMIIPVLSPLADCGVSLGLAPSPQAHRAAPEDQTLGAFRFFIARHAKTSW